MRALLFPLPLLCLCFVSACATGRTYEKDKASQNVTVSGATVTSVPGVSAEAVGVGVGVGALAAATAVASPSYYKSATIRGRIQRQRVTDTIGSPCGQCSFRLICRFAGKDPEAPIVGQTDNSGNFSVLAKPDQLCEIAPVAERFALHDESAHVLTPGNFYSLTFVEYRPKRAPATP